MSRLVAALGLGAALAWAAPARADLPRDFPERCLEERVQRTGEMCERCARTAGRREENEACTRRLEARFFEHRCGGGRATVGYTIWCRPTSEVAARAHIKERDAAIARGECCEGVDPLCPYFEQCPPGQKSLVDSSPPPSAAPSASSAASSVASAAPSAAPAAPSASAVRGEPHGACACGVPSSSDSAAGWGAVSALVALAWAARARRAQRFFSSRFLN